MPLVSWARRCVLETAVGTVTEVYDYIRLLFARVGSAYSYITQKKMVNYSDDQIIELIVNEYADKKITILSPLIRSRKGHYRELFDSMARQGFIRVRIDGEIVNLKSSLKN